MTLEEIITRLRARVADQAEERQKHVDAITAIRSACATDERDPTDDEAAKVRAAAEARDKIDEDIADCQKRADELQAELDGNEKARALMSADDKKQRTYSPARVAREERTYTKEKSTRGQASFFVDVFAAREGDAAASERLARNYAEAVAEGEVSERATTTSSFGNLVVPQYLIDEAALIARAGRPFANTVRGLPLPPQGMTLDVPRATTGAATAVQATQNTSVQNTDEVWTDLSVPVVTIAGQQDVSRQTLERGTPGIDEIVYTDLAGDYMRQVDVQVLSGSGSSGQALGVLATSGVNQATAFTAAATPTTLYSKTAGQVNAVETLRYLPPSAIAMHPRRWNWLIAQVDTTNRPLAVPAGQGAFNSLAAVQSLVDTSSASPVGAFLGLPVITDASIPTSVGTGPEDQVIVYRREDLMLWEDGDGMPKRLRFEQTLGNQLTVKLVVYGYIAFTAGRYPTAVGIIGGNAGTAGFGLIAPTF